DWPEPKWGNASSEEDLLIYVESQCEACTLKGVCDGVEQRDEAFSSSVDFGKVEESRRNFTLHLSKTASYPNIFEALNNSPALEPLVAKIGGKTRAMLSMNVYTGYFKGFFYESALGQAVDAPNPTDEKVLSVLCGVMYRFRYERLKVLML